LRRLADILGLERTTLTRNPAAIDSIERLAKTTAASTNARAGRQDSRREEAPFSPVFDERDTISIDRPLCARFVDRYHRPLDYYFPTLSGDVSWRA
jgi:hypothetical protein